jgi:hypothetical protein
MSQDDAGDEHDSHRGTFVLLMLYLVLIAAMWISVYYLMLVRG